MLWQESKTTEDTIEPYTAPTSISSSELISLITNVLVKKSKKYGKVQCENIDALVYMNLNRYLKPSSENTKLNELHMQGWRSVSVLFPPYGIVLLATDSAPDFLRSKVGCFLNSWKQIDSLFD